MVKKLFLLLTKPIFLIFFFITACSNKFFIPPHIFSELKTVNLSVANDSIASSEFINHFNNIIGYNAQDHQTYKYKLEVEIKSESSSLAVQKNTEVIRQQVNQIIIYKLYSLPDMKLLTTNNIRQISSYNTLFSPYSSNIENEQMHINLARQAAEEMRNRLISFFKKSNFE